MSSSNNFSTDFKRKLRKSCPTASLVLAEHNKPVSDNKASILHNKGTAVSQDLNLAESCGRTKTRNKKDKPQPQPQAANQRAFPESPVCLRKTRKNGHVFSKSHETETFVPPSKTLHNRRKKKNVQPSKKKAASNACSDGLVISAHNSSLEQHLSSGKTRGTRYQHSKKTQNHQTSSDVSTGPHTLSPPHNKILSFHTKTPPTPNSDLQPLSPERVKNSSIPSYHQNVKKTPTRGRPRGSKNKSGQGLPCASPPVKRSRRTAMSPVASPQEEPSVETQTPSMPCFETQETNPKESGLCTLSFPHDKISSSHTKTPHTPKRGRPRSSPLLSSTPNSDHQPLSPKTAKNSSLPRYLQNVKKTPPVDATPSRPQRPRGRPRGSKKKNAQELPSAFLPVKPQRPRGRPRGSKNKGTSPPVKRSRRTAVSLVESPQEEPSVETQSPCTPCFETQRANRKESDQTMSSDLSIELNLQQEPVPVNGSSFMHEEEEDQDDDEEELPSFLRQDNRKPLSISKGRYVWCKLRKYPYWPAVVKSVNHKSKKASVVFIDGLINKKINKGLTVSLRTLKPFDCEDYEKLVHVAKEKYGSAITWSLELITDYRIRIGCGSFSGSFIEYCAADISCPVRRKYSEGKSELTLPNQEILDEPCDISDNNTEDIVVEEQDELLSKKVLPDRTKAARNRANKQLVDFIIRRKVEERLLAVISGQESSKWMQALQKPCRSVVDVYLEDEEQIDKVFRYLDKVCDNAPQINTCLENTQVDKIRLILDVLLPEAIIYAIAGVHKLSLEKAEEKYRKGPCFSNRERQEFDMMIEQQMKLKETTQH